VAQALWFLSEPPPHRAIDRPWSPTGGTSEEEAITCCERLFDTGKQSGGEVLSNRVG